MNSWRFTYDSKQQPHTRISLVDSGTFDEFVLKGRDGRALIHVEVMDTGRIWMQVGDAYVWIYDAPGGVEVYVRRGEYGPVNGVTEAPGVCLESTVKTKGKKRKGVR